MKLKEEEYLAHYGILRKSGRYPWGSGGTPLQRSKTYLDTINELKRQGMTEAEIARGFSRPDAPFTTNDLRNLRTQARTEIKQDQIRQIERLADRGWSNVKIGERMGLNESTVRSLRAPHQKEKLDILQSTADMLKRQVDEKGAIDIGTQVERALPLSDNPAQLIGISDTKFKTAVSMLRQQGYVTHSVKVPQLGNPGKFTDIKVLARPDVKWSDMIRDPALIKSITEHSPDGGRNYIAHRDVINISSKRIKVKYAEDGGGAKDGLIEIRPGAKDLDMGRSRYAQVRIGVDGSHYLKGMAIYNPDLPAGTDIRFNTNKSKTKNTKMDVMKPMDKDPQTGKIDMKNPFGAYIKPDGQRGALNIINEQGDWDKWNKSLPSQMLSKQNDKLAKTQLDVTYERRRKELDAIKDLTNPAVKRKLLDTFADETDSSAVHLEAAARVGQTTKVLIPVTSVKPTEIYCPSLPDGTRVALVRFPHGGTFEIPEVRVNNRNPEARKLLGNAAQDAVAIHHQVAERLSGADFDGDHVLVIPNNKGEVKSSPALKGLEDFDPRTTYGPYDGMRTIDGGTWDAKTKTVDYGGKFPKGGTMQNEMGKVTNLITDMTVRGAPDDDKARAVRHSMVIIDAEKHSLDYKRSADVNGIADLKRKYQGVSRSGQPAGASTLLSKATAEERFPMRKPRPAKDGGPIDKRTGKKVFVETGETYVDRKGNVVVKKFKADRLSVIEDAHTLSSGTSIERLYADHSNKLKALGNEARKESINTKNTPMSQSAKTVYHKEVESLDAKLSVALKNAPLERQAQAIGNSIVSQKKAANPNLQPGDVKKINRLALEEARFRTGANKTRIDLTQAEWNAIQAGAISNNKLEQILRNANLEPIRKLATPKQQLKMSPSKTARAKTMLAQGYTLAEVADNLGVALSTLKLGIDEGGE